MMKQNVLGTNNGSLSVQKTEVKSNGLVNGEVKDETEEVETKMEVPSEQPWGLCLGPSRVDECAVHSEVLTRVTWSYYSSVDQVNQLLDSHFDSASRTYLCLNFFPFLIITQSTNSPARFCMGRHGLNSENA